MYTAKHANLLISCLRNQNQDHIAALEEFSVNDWNDLVQFSIIQEITTILLKNLEEQGLLAKLPNRIKIQLLAAYLHSATVTDVFSRNFQTIFKAFLDNNIRFIALKGAHLGATVYENSALRPMGDLDILVKKGDLTKASSALENIGYLKVQKSEQATDHHLPKFVKENSVPVEVHWDIGPISYPYKYDIASLWKRARTTTIAGERVLTFCAEDLLLHLCLHICKHNFQVGLRSLYDIGVVIQRYDKELSWSIIVNRSVTWRATKAVYTVLRLAEEMLGAPCPGHYMRALRPNDFSPEILEWTKNQILAYGSPLSNNLGQLRKISRLSDKLKLVIERLFYTQEKVKDSTNSYSALGNAVLRSRRLLAEYGIFAWRMFHESAEDLILPDEEEASKLHDWLSQV